MGPSRQLRGGYPAHAHPRTSAGCNPQSQTRDARALVTFDCASSIRRIISSWQPSAD
jgi:hypothetical protein